MAKRRTTTTTPVTKPTDNAQPEGAAVYERAADDSGGVRQVGYVLIIVGLLDIAAMIYHVANQMSYSSSFNILAVVGGVFLLDGSLKAARVIAWISAFFLTAGGGLMVATLLLFPFDLLLTQIRLTENYALPELALIAGSLLLLGWVYRRLTSPAVLHRMDQRQINHTSFWRNPARGFWVGAGIPVTVVVAFGLLTHGAEAEEAKQRASIQVGPEYKLHLKTLNIHSGNGSKQIRAVVTAYNNGGVKDVTVEWTE